MDPNNSKPVRDPGTKTKNKLEPLDTKIKRQKPASTRVLLTWQKRLVTHSLKAGDRRLKPLTAPKGCKTRTVSSAEKELGKGGEDL